MTDLNDRYKVLFEFAADAILTGDPDGNITGANRSATELSGYPRHELIGLNLAHLFSAEEHRKSPLRYDLLRAGESVQNKRRLARKDGTTVPISMHSRMMPDGTFHTFMRDITEQHALEEKLKESNRELEAFVYTVSHDLRTPLSSVIGYTDYLLERGRTTLDEQTLEVLAKIEKAGDEMLCLMESLLDLARAGTLERPVEPVALNEVVASSLRKLQSRIVATGTTVESDPLPEIRVPNLSLAQVLDNLLGNALRYAGADGAPIRIGGSRTDRSVRFFVRDHGPGIPETERKKVFDLFFRGGQGQKKKGVGIGLTIVEKIARAYGGRAWLEATPGGGCTFWVEMEDSPPG